MNETVIDFIISSEHILPETRVRSSLRGCDDYGTGPFNDMNSKVQFSVIDSEASEIMENEKDLKDKPLHGVIAFVDVRVEHENRSRAVSKELSKLGAVTVDKITYNVTHVVFKDGRKSTLSQLRKHSKIHLVSVLWIDACKTSMCRVPEGNFPATIIPNTPCPVAKSRRVKSLQPKTFEEDLNNSAKKEERKRKRLLRLHRNVNNTPPDPVLCLDSQDYMKCSDLHKLVNTPRVVPETPWIINYINSGDIETIDSCHNIGNDIQLKLDFEVDEKESEDGQVRSEENCSQMELCKTVDVKQPSKKMILKKKKKLLSKMTYFSPHDGEVGSISMDYKRKRLERSGNEITPIDCKNRQKNEIAKQLGLMTNKVSDSNNDGSINHFTATSTSSSNEQIVGALNAKRKSSKLQTCPAIVPASEPVLINDRFNVKNTLVRMEEGLEKKDFPILSPKTGIGKRTPKYSNLQISPQQSTYVLETNDSSKKESLVKSALKQSTPKQELSMYTKVLKESGNTPNRDVAKKTKRPCSTENDETQDNERESFSDDGSDESVEFVFPFMLSPCANPQKTIKRKTERKEKVCLSMTSLHYSEQDFVKAACKRLGNCVISSNVQAGTTHLIAGTAKRTLNILHAIARGCWVLSPKWVCDSYELGEWKNEEGYEMWREFPAAKESRISCAIHGEAFCASLFAALPPFYLSDDMQPPKNEVIKLVKLCGGHVATSIRRSGIGIGPLPSRKYPFQIVSVKWLLDSINRAELLSTTRYKIN